MNHWRPRDYLAAALLFFVTAAFVLWQNSRVAVLWDLGYLLDTSWRIALGQMPYRDFPFAHAPLTFLIQAVLIRFAGRNYVIQIADAAFAGGFATVLTWRILLRILRAAHGLASASWVTALLLAAPLTVLGIYSIYPHPIYDCDCTLAILIAILLLLQSDLALAAVAQKEETIITSCHPERSAVLRRGVEGSEVAFLRFIPNRLQIASLAAGAATVMPLFFKQNMGLPLVAVAAACMLVLLAREWLRTPSLDAISRSQPALILAAMTAALVIGCCLVAATAGFGNYFHWTVQFAAQRRLPGFGSMLSVYNQPSFQWTLPALSAGLILCHTRWIGRLWTRILAFALITAPFVGSLIFLLLDDDADERADNLLALWPLLLLAAAVIAFFELRRGLILRRLIPFFALAAIHGTFLSQQLWGSTYALWPLLLVLIAFLLAALPPQARPVALAGTAVIAATFFVCGLLYSLSMERLRYVQIPQEPPQHSSRMALRGMATPGPYLSNFDELIDFAAREVPPGDVLLALPGEDPFFYATGRTPQFPVTLFDPATDPYAPAALISEARRRNVRWVIVKRTLQINESPMPDKEQTLKLVAQDFALYRRLKGYDVYLRK